MGGSKKFARADSKVSGRQKLMLWGENPGDLVFQEALQYVMSLKHLL